MVTYSNNRNNNSRQTSSQQSHYYRMRNEKGSHTSSSGSSSGQLHSYSYRSNRSNHSHYFRSMPSVEKSELSRRRKSVYDHVQVRERRCCFCSCCCCCCTTVLAIALIAASILFGFFFWLRRPEIQTIQLDSNPPQFSIQDNTLNFSTVFSLTIFNPNYFSVKLTTFDLMTFYPVSNNLKIGEYSNDQFVVDLRSSKNLTIPYDFSYNPLDDNGVVLQNLIVRCGLIDRPPQPIEIRYDLEIGFQVIQSHGSIPIISNTTSFECPIKSLQQLEEIPGLQNILRLALSNLGRSDALPPNGSQDNSSSNSSPPPSNDGDPNNLQS